MVEGKGHSVGIQTILERKTRFYDGRLLVNIDSEYGQKAQKEMLIKYPKEARQSLTLDNGRENFNHHKLIRDLGIKTYFCDPHCPWQKGSNENHNGILRRYIPKKTDMTTITQTELNWILEEINSRPTLCLINKFLLLEIISLKFSSPLSTDFLTRNKVFSKVTFTSLFDT